MTIFSLLHQFTTPESLGMAEEEELLDYSEDPMEGQLIWCGTSVQHFGSDSSVGNTKCGLGVRLLSAREQDRSDPSLGRLGNTSISETPSIFPPEVASAWGSTGGSDTPFPWQTSKDNTQADVWGLSSWYGSLPFPSSDSSAFFCEGDYSGFELGTIVPLPFWPQPSSSHPVNQFAHSLLPHEQNPSPPQPDSRLVVQFPDHFLMLPDITKPVEVVCHRKEPQSNRDYGVKDCGKNLGPKPTPHRKRNSGVKSGAPLNLVLGQDISIPMVVDMENRAVVGKARGRQFGIKTLKEWVGRVWVHEVYVLPEVTTLARGWILFKFRKEEDAERVLKKPWLLDSTPLLLKRWTPLFDASKERLNVMSIWVRLLGLPPKLWTELSFKELGNALGTFMDT
jgi:hypothetical protein